MNHRKQGIVTFGNAMFSWTGANNI